MSEQDLRTASGIALFLIVSGALAIFGCVRWIRFDVFIA